jgi:polysaccharide chain length determinant protein (PEP-CTERM system associated)
MLPGKKYGPEDVLRILSKRWWMLVVPLIAGAAGGWHYARQLPDQYRSESLIMLVHQRIPDSYVKTTVTARVEDRLVTVKDQMLSRSRLEQIIRELDLYPDQRHATPMEVVVERMRQEVDVSVAGKESFRVSYVSASAAAAQKATERLVSMFIDENLKDREVVAEDTNRFLDAQLGDAKRRLIDQERRLEEYRRRYSGQLPSQLTANLQAIQNAQTQRSALGESADRIRERRLTIERQVTELQTPDPLSAAGTSPAAPGSPDPSPGESTEQQLETARASLRILEATNTSDHPDVRLMRRRIGDLEEKLRAEAASGQPVPTATGRPIDAARQRRIRGLEAQLADMDRQLNDYAQQDAKLREVLRDYQSKVDAVPARESELVELTRDYSTLQNSYQTLLAKREESKIAVDLERRNIGEQFRVLDPARVPERPFSPDRLRIQLVGAIAGLMLGLVVVGLLEYRDFQFHSEEDIGRILALPVLVVVPMMYSASDLRLRRTRRTLAFGAGTFLLVGSAAALAWWRMHV